MSGKKSLRLLQLTALLQIAAIAVAVAYPAQTREFLSAIYSLLFE